MQFITQSVYNWGALLLLGSHLCDFSKLSLVSIYIPWWILQWFPACLKGRDGRVGTSFQNAAELKTDKDDKRCTCPCYLVSCLSVFIAAVFSSLCFMCFMCVYIKKCGIGMKQ